tara:strand:- start:3391 stop:3702 length:312 start_codon:yes stop_codon:yes gene_type:complete
MDTNSIACLFSGALGGVMFHSYWLISLANEAKGDPINNSSEHGRFRVKMMLLKILTGAVAGYIVSVWYMGTDAMPLNKLVVLAFIAGLSGDGFLGFLKKISGK